MRGSGGHKSTLVTPHLSWAITTTLVCLVVHAASLSHDVGAQTTDNDSNSISQQIDSAQKKLLEVQEILNNLKSLFAKQQPQQSSVDVNPRPPEIVANLQQPPVIVANSIEAHGTLEQSATSNSDGARDKSQAGDEPTSLPAQTPPESHQNTNLQPVADPAQVSIGQQEMRAPSSEPPATGSPIGPSDHSLEADDGDDDDEGEDEDESGINDSEAHEASEREPASTNNEVAHDSTAPEARDPEVRADERHPAAAAAAEQTHQVEEQNLPSPSKEVIVPTTEAPIVAPAQSTEQQREPTFAEQQPVVQVFQVPPQETVKNVQANHQQQQLNQATNNNAATPTQQAGLSPQSSLDQQPNSPTSSPAQVVQLTNVQTESVPSQSAPSRTDLHPHANEVSTEAMESSPVFASEPAKAQLNEQQQHREEQQNQPTQTVANPFSNWRQLFGNPAKLISANRNQQQVTPANPFATDKRQTYEQPGENYGQKSTTSVASGSGSGNQNQQQQPRTSTFSVPKLPSLKNPFSSGGRNEPPLAVANQRAQQQQQQRPLSALGGNNQEGLMPQEQRGRGEEPFVFRAERDPNAPPPHRRLRKFRRFLRHPKSTLTSFVHKHHEHHESDDEARGEGIHQGDAHLLNQADHHEQQQSSSHSSQLGGSDHGGLDVSASEVENAAGGRLHELWNRFKTTSLVSGAVGKFQTHVAPRVKSTRDQATHALEKVRDRATSHRAKRREVNDVQGDDENDRDAGQSSGGFPFPTQRVVPDMLGRLPQVPPVHQASATNGKQSQQTWHNQQANAAAGHHQERRSSLPDGGRSFRRQQSSSHMTSSHSIST